MDKQTPPRWHWATRIVLDDDGYYVGTVREKRAGAGTVATVRKDGKVIHTI